MSPHQSLPWLLLAANVLNGAPNGLVILLPSLYLTWYSGLSAASIPAKLVCLSMIPTYVVDRETLDCDVSPPMYVHVEAGMCTNGPAT